MPRHKKIEHVELCVPDVRAATSFCTDILGLSLLEATESATYLGCGFDENYDVAFRQGEPGLGHAAMRVTTDELDALESRLADHDVESERHDGREPGEKAGVRFTVPPGVTLEAVVVADTGLHNYDKSSSDRDGAAPLDLDHITLGVPDVRATTEFLVDVIGYDATTIKTTTGDRDGEWVGTFVRDGAGYHDIATLGRESSFIHHVAWEMVGVDHMKSAIDRVADAGYRLETSIHRHDGTNNLAAYFLEPGGPHMYEFCTEEATVGEDTPTIVTTPEEVSFSAWGGVSPPSHPRRESE